MTQTINWDQRYQNKDYPWVHQDPVPHLLATIAGYLPATASILEIGCGFGVESVALQQVGYQVDAVDIAVTAVEKARQLAKAHGVDCYYQVHDITKQPMPRQYDAALDVAVFHCVAQTERYPLFIEHVAASLKEHGYWFCMACLYPDVCAHEQSTGLKSPPTITYPAFKGWIQGQFQLVQEVDTSYTINRSGKEATFPASLFVLRKI